MRLLVDPRITSIFGGKKASSNLHYLITALFAFGFFYLLLSREWNSDHELRWKVLQEVAVDEPDGFANFVKAPGCNVSSHQLHHAFEPKCPTRQSLLTAMGSGGRYGWDKPYAPLDCDMYWLSPDEICQTMMKFTQVHVIGDSLARQLVLAIHIILREDLVNGAHATWLPGNDQGDGEECYCRAMFSAGTHKSCFWYEAIDTGMIIDNDPDSISCGKDVARVKNAFLAKYPIPEKDLNAYFDSLVEEGISKKLNQVFILSQGGWNHYNASETMAWIDQIEAQAKEKIPSYFTSPRLFVTPLAQGENKPDKYIKDFNNIMVMRHSHKLEPKLRRKGYEFLSSFNMSMQAVTPDSIHGSLETTLLQAMMVYNWLKFL